MSPTEPLQPPKRQHPKPGPEVRADIERVLHLLRSLIHQRGYTQLKVQDALGWGRTYISQLFRQQKSLRLDQVLQILQVIEVPPADFFSCLYGQNPAASRQLEGSLRRPPGPSLRARHSSALLPKVGAGNTEPTQDQEEEMRQLFDLVLTLTNLLEAKGLVQRSELARALANYAASEHTADKHSLGTWLGFGDAEVAP